MQKHRFNWIMVILIMNMGFISILSSLMFRNQLEVSIINSETSNSTPLHESEAAALPSFLSFNENSDVLSVEDPYSRSELNLNYLIQQLNVSTILNETGINNSGAIQYVENIWADVLGSDSKAIDNPSHYQNGTIVTDIAEVNNSLFTRIGNSGYGSIVNETRRAEIKDGLSTGWKIGFPIQNDYDLINVSFKWRFDALDGAFDNYTVIENLGIILDDSTDYQEIRARISHPLDENKSFWLNAPVTTNNPNGSVFYRYGPEVTLDEEWFTFSSSFHVSPVGGSNFTLELGAFLNTREYYNEYLDVWFDDILIVGYNNVTDSTPPVPKNYGLARTKTVERNKFWASFAEGTWASQIKNVTLFYNRTGTNSSFNVNASLEYIAPSYINNAGYNETYWQYFENFTFDDVIDFYYEIFDDANNSYKTDVQSTIIQDNAAPEIISSTNVNDVNFVYEMGNGTIIIRVDTEDFGDATDTVVLKYRFNITAPIFTIPMTQNGTQYYTKLSVPYNSLLHFEIQLNDTKGNTRSYPGYSVTTKTDNIDPAINKFDIKASEEDEGKTFIIVNATDAFGEVDRVFLIVSSLTTAGFGSFFGNLSLVPEEGIYRLGIPLELNYSVNYSFTVVVRDGAGHEVNQTKYYIVPDIVKPKISFIEEEYIIPGFVRIWVSASDLGSGLNESELNLEVKTNGEWKQVTFDGKSNGRYYFDLTTDIIGNKWLEYRINAKDNVLPIPNSITVEKTYLIPLFITTIPGLVASQLAVVAVFVIFFTLIKLVQRRRVRVIRRRRFDLALDHSERLSYIGEEAIFGFVAAYAQTEGISSILMWEPLLVGNFYQFFKELSEKANSAVSFIMKTRPQDSVTFIDFDIEEISCSAITFAYPLSILPQRWLSTVTLDQVPMEGGQGVLLLMLLMRDKWTQAASNFQDEIADGIQEIKALILSNEDKENILQKIREFRLFISGTVEVLEEIETEVDDISDDIMKDFEDELLGSPDEEENS